MAQHAGIQPRICALLRDPFAAADTSGWSVGDINHLIVMVFMANHIGCELQKAFSDGLASAAPVCRVYPSNYV
jgi:hypothetical protein